MLSSFWKSGMKSQAEMDADLRERVAINAIYSQKMVEPQPTAAEGDSAVGRVSHRPMYGVVHADMKHSDAGTLSTFLAAEYYADENKKRRDELLAKYSGDKSEE